MDETFDHEMLRLIANPRKNKSFQKKNFDDVLYENRIYNMETLHFKLLNKNNIIEFLKNNGEMWETLWKEYKILQKYRLEDREEISLKS